MNNSSPPIARPREISDAELDALLSRLPMATQVLLLRKMVRDFSGFGAIQCGVLADAVERWRPMLPPAEMEWLTGRMRSATQDLQHDSQARTRVALRKLGNGTPPTAGA